MIARVTVAATVQRGAVVPVRINILHKMETGHRYDVDGRAIPKNVIHTLTCRFLGETIFRAEMGSGMAANPSVQFYFVADAVGEGELLFEWQDDTGQRGSQRTALKVVA